MSKNVKSFKLKDIRLIEPLAPQERNLLERLAKGGDVAIVDLYESMQCTIAAKLPHRYMQQRVGGCIARVNKKLAVAYVGVGEARKTYRLYQSQ